jgi:chemotaxis protein methyltransferase CheR
VLNSPSLSKGLIEAFIRLIAKHTGLEIRERDKVALSEKIVLRMKALKLDIPQSYYQLLNSSISENQQEWKELVSLLTNIETYFFRDKDQFSLLRNHIFPELIQRKQNQKSFVFVVQDAHLEKNLILWLFFSKSFFPISKNGIS